VAAAAAAAAAAAYVVATSSLECHLLVFCQHAMGMCILETSLQLLIPYRYSYISEHAGTAMKLASGCFATYVLHDKWPELA